MQSVGVFVGGYGIPAIPTPPSQGVHLSQVHQPSKPRISSHRIHRIHGSFRRRIFSHGFHRCSQIFRLRFCLLICAHLCLSVGGTSLPECSVCSAYSVEHSLCLLCWCCRGSCTSVVVFSHGFPQMVRLRYWLRGYGRDAIPSY